MENNFILMAPLQKDLFCGKSEKSKKTWREEATWET
jgi:hypothetical protein